MLKIKVGGSTVKEAVHTRIHGNTLPSILNAEILMQTLHVNYMQFR